MIYGEDHYILRTWQLQKKGNEVGAAGRIWEGDSVQLAAKEVRLTLAIAIRRLPSPFPSKRAMQVLMLS